jgi:hypothetical protein
MRSTAVACLLQVAQEQGEDQDDGYDDSTPFGCQTAFAGLGVVAVVVGAVLVPTEGVGVFFGGFVWEHDFFELFSSYSCTTLPSSLTQIYTNLAADFSHVIFFARLR